MAHVMEKFSLDGQTALVTGGAGLLGKQFTRTLGEAGAKVVVADINFDGAFDHSMKLREAGIPAIAVRVDVTNPGSVQAMVDHTIAEFGSLDILVTSAALDPKFDPDHLQEQSANAFETYPLAAWQEGMSVNLTGSFLASQAAAAHMVQQGHGVIIFISSVYGMVGPDQRIYPVVDGKQQFKPVTYAVSKAGIIGLTHHLAAYYAGTDIRINAISPGGVYDNHNEEFTQKYGQKVMMGRMAAVDEINGALLYLASDASTFVTGTNMVVDGGYTAW